MQIKEQALCNAKDNQGAVTSGSGFVLQCPHKSQPAKWAGDQAKIYFLDGSTVSGSEVH